MQDHTTQWDFTLTPSDSGYSASVQMQSTIPNEHRNPENEFASILLSIGHLTDNHDPLRGLIFLIASSLNEYAEVQMVGDKPLSSPSGLETMKYMLINWLEFPNEMGEKGDPAELDITAANVSAVDSISPLVQAVRQQIYSLKNREERDQVLLQLLKLFEEE